MPLDSTAAAAPPTPISLTTLAQYLGAELHPSSSAGASTLIIGIAGIEDALPGQITFVANPKYSPLARTTRASAVLVELDFPEVPVATLRLPNPYLAFARALELFHLRPLYPPGIHPSAVVSPTARIGANAHIGALAVVSEHCFLGDDAVLLPHVILYPHVHVGHRFFAHAHAVVREFCRLGDDVLLQNGAIVGADGFGFARQKGPGHEGSAWYKIPQTGPVVLGDNVEVQANACIDRASIGETRIGSGTKVDNLVQVGHGSIVGQDTLLCSQVGLAGSSTVGNNVILAGQVGRRRPLGHRRRRHGHRAERCPRRCRPRHDHQRLPRLRPPRVDALRRRLPPPARTNPKVFRRIEVNLFLKQILNRCIPPNAVR